MKVPGRFARLNKDGLVEIVDEKTGQILAIQEDMLEVGKDGFYEAELQDGTKVLIQKGVSLDKVTGYKSIPFSNVMADVICQKVVEGHSLTQICGKDGIPPYPTVIRWQQQHPEFKEALQYARQDRSETFHDKAINQAEKSIDSGADKLRVDTYKWAASVGNPETYGSKTKVIGDKNAPLQLIVDTGIRRPEDYNKDEALQSRDVEELGGEIGKADSEIHNAIAAADTSGGGDATETSGD